MSKNKKYLLIKLGSKINEINIGIDPILIISRKFEKRVKIEINIYTFFSLLFNNPYVLLKFSNNILNHAY